MYIFDGALESSIFSTIVERSSILSHKRAHNYVYYNIYITRVIIAVFIIAIDFSHLLYFSVLYIADYSSGTSRDWAAGVANIPYVYTIELRDRGEFEFELPRSQIIPTGEETWAGIQAMVQYQLDLTTEESDE